MTGADRIIGVVFVLVSSASEAVGQLAFKRAASQRPAGQVNMSIVAPLGPFTSALHNLRWVLLGWISFVIDGLLWSAALYYMDVSVAHPIGSIVFVVVAIFSKLFLHEHVSPRRWIGICFILAGAAIVVVN
jgi:drug/metabolite transporter (DMT)-like permease